MTPRDLAYWLSGRFEAVGVEGIERLGDASAESVRRHAALVLASHPNDSFALTVHALSAHPAALRDVVAAHVVSLTTRAPLAISPDDFALDLAKVMDEMKKVRPAGSPGGWPVLFC